MRVPTIKFWKNDIIPSHGKIARHKAVKKTAIDEKKMNGLFLTAFCLYLMKTYIMTSSPSPNAIPSPVYTSLKNLTSRNIWGISTLNKSARCIPFACIAQSMSFHSVMTTFSFFMLSRKGRMKYILTAIEADAVLSRFKKRFNLNVLLKRTRHVRTVAMATSSVLMICDSITPV